MRGPRGRAPIWGQIEEPPSASSTLRGLPGTSCEETEPSSGRPRERTPWVCHPGVPCRCPRPPFGPSSPRNKAEATVPWAQAPPSGGQPAPAFPGPLSCSQLAPGSGLGALGTRRLSVRLHGNCRFGHRRPLSTRAPPTRSPASSGPRSPVLRAAEFKCQIDPRSGSDCALVTV